MEIMLDFHICLHRGNRLCGVLVNYGSQCTQLTISVGSQHTIDVMWEEGEFLMKWKYISNAYSCQKARYTCVGLE